MASPLSNAINAARGVPLPGGISIGGAPYPGGPPQSFSPASPAPGGGTQPIMQPFSPNPYAGIGSVPGVTSPAQPFSPGGFPAFGTRGVGVIPPPISPTGPITLPISRVDPRDPITTPISPLPDRIADEAPLRRVMQATPGMAGQSPQVMQQLQRLYGQ
jgi:hypothetical protein